MRFAQMAPVNDGIAEMQRIYGQFDIADDGMPTASWVGRNLRKWRPPEMLQMEYFPDVYVRKLLVNRKIFDPLCLIYEEIMARWTTEARRTHGLNRFVKCYCFSSGDVPSLFWFAACWRLSPQVSGEVLAEVVKLFCAHGFTWCGVSDKRRIRDFEMW